MNHTPTTVPAYGTPCQNRHPDLWFSDVREDVEKAKAGCAVCPIRAACLAGAIERHEPAGVWGGVRFEAGRPLDRTPQRTRLTERERRHAEAERRRRSREAAAARRGSRLKSDVDHARVERAVHAVGARIPVGDTLTLGERVEVLRRVFPRYGLSTDALAELLGVSPRTINRDVGRVLDLADASSSAA